MRMLGKVVTPRGFEPDERRFHKGATVQAFPRKAVAVRRVRLRFTVRGRRRESTRIDLRLGDGLETNRATGRGSPLAPPPS